METEKWGDRDETDFTGRKRACMREQLAEILREEQYEVAEADGYRGGSGSSEAADGSVYSGYRASGWRRV